MKFEEAKKALLSIIKYYHCYDKSLYKTVSQFYNNFCNDLVDLEPIHLDKIDQSKHSNEIQLLLERYYKIVKDIYFESVKNNNKNEFLRDIILSIFLCNDVVLSAVTLNYDEVLLVRRNKKLSGYKIIIV